MAKVNGPLMSVSASGKLGNALVYDKRGYVRKYVVPANPQSVAQMAIRNILGDIQRELKELGAVKRPLVSEALGYRWGSVVVSELMANDHAKWDSLGTDYDAFIAGDKTAWGTADPGIGLVGTAGKVFYCVAKATYDVCLRLTGSGIITAPVTGNGAAMGAEWIADA